MLQYIPRPRWAAPVLVALGILASFAEAAGILLIPLFLYSVMNQLDALAATGGLLGILLRYALARFRDSREIAVLFFALIVLRGVIAYVYGMATARVGEQINQTARDRVHSLYLRLPYRFVEQYERAELAEALGREASLPANAYQSLTRVLVNSTFIIMLGALLIVISWRITLCVAVGSLLLSGAVGLLSARAYRIGNQVKHVHQELWDQMMATLQGMRTIRAFAQETPHEDRFNQISGDVRAAAIRTAQLTLLLDPLTEVGYLIILGIVVLAGPHFGVSFASTLTCVALLYRLQPHVSEIEGHRLNLLQLEPQFELVGSILEQQVSVLAGQRSAATLEHHIRFDRVTFSYSSQGAPAIDNVSFDIPVGSVTVLFGPSGSGKTTIVNLLLKLYAPDSGCVYVDGTPLQAINSSDWLKQVAVAGQDIDLIDGTVLENIRMADPLAGDEAIDAAARLSGLYEVLDNLPDRYQTTIGQHGSRFSGGQRQLIGLTRVVLRDPRFLILDEAMGAMDLDLERRVRDNIEKHFVGRTILVITHNMETVMRADHVVWIEEGRVVGHGKPADLLQNR